MGPAGKYPGRRTEKIFPGYPERTSVVDFVGAASSRERFNSRLEAAPTAVSHSDLSLPDK